VDHIFINLHVIGGHRQRLKLGAKLVLRGGNLLAWARSKKSITIEVN
jgi:hypothetical protein